MITSPDEEIAELRCDMAHEVMQNDWCERLAPLHHIIEATETLGQELGLSLPETQLLLESQVFAFNGRLGGTFWKDQGPTIDFCGLFAKLPPQEELQQILEGDIATAQVVLELRYMERQQN